MICLKNVSKIYNANRENEFKALDHVTFEVDKGEMVAIMGKSGAGKSTLLHILACIDTFEEGEYFLENNQLQNLSEKEYARIRNEKIGIVMQDYALIEDFTVLENVLIPLEFAKSPVKNRAAIAKEALSKVGMDAFLKKRAGKLSGGQKQRVAIARAIVNEPGIILADEPTGALDSKTSAEIMGIFKELNRQGKTIIIVTHDITVAEQCDRMIEIADGRIASGDVSE